MHSLVGWRLATREPHSQPVVTVPQCLADESREHQRRGRERAVAFRVDVALGLEAQRDPLLAPHLIGALVVIVDDRRAAGSSAPASPWSRIR